MTAPRSVTVTTSSRLHFGLFAFDAAVGPSFGGAGMMVAEPSLRVRATRAERFTAFGPLAERAAKIAAQLSECGILAEPPRCQLEVLAAPPEHSGLGSGTQLSLAVAVAIARLTNGTAPDVRKLAACLRRGRRSAIGTHGFLNGGLLVDSGKPTSETIAPLAARAEFPEAWRVLLLLPAARGVTGGIGIAGEVEERAFARLPSVSSDTTDSLRKLALEEIIPAARIADLSAFAAAVSRFNEVSGNCFATVQGGPYATPLAETWIKRLAALGAPAGQSSWGPALFAFADGDAQAETLAAAIRHDAAADGWQVQVTRASNRGATIEVD